MLPFRYMSGTSQPRWEAEHLTPSAAAAALAPGGRSGLYRVTGGNLTVPLLLRIGLDEKGELVCTGISMGLDVNPPVRVTAAAMRFRLQEILGFLARRIDQVEVVRLRSGGVAWHGDLPPREMAEAFALIEPPVGLRARPGPKGYTAEQLRDLVRLYAQALKDTPRKATQTVAKLQQINLSTQAIRYQLRKAEKRGLMPKRLRDQRRALRKRSGGRR